MIAAMLLAHLIADFVFQPDRLAIWKSEDWRGVAVHGLIVFLVTAFFVWLVAPGWWVGVLFISLVHLGIDMLAWIYFPGPVSLRRFLLDQALHLATILVALVAGGFLTDPSGMLTSRQHEGLLIALGLVFLSMPAWVLLKFVGYSLVESKPPVFQDGCSKYIGISERLIAVTLLILGQFLLLPLVLLPRLLLSRPLLFGPTHRAVHAFELLAGLTLAGMIAAGLTFSASVT